MLIIIAYFMFIRSYDFRSCPDILILPVPFSRMDGLQPAGRRYWIREEEADADIVNIGEEVGQKGTKVKIQVPMSHNALTIDEEYVKCG